MPNNKMASLPQMHKKKTDFAVVCSLREAVDGKGVTTRDILGTSKELRHFGGCLPRFAHLPNGGILRMRI